jgi:hypothetical protein
MLQVSEWRRLHMYACSSLRGSGCYGTKISQGGSEGRLRICIAWAGEACVVVVAEAGTVQRAARRSGPLTGREHGGAVALQRTMLSRIRGQQADKRRMTQVSGVQLGWLRKGRLCGLCRGRPITAAPSRRSVAVL